MADIQRIVAVALNPAVDRVLEVPRLTPGAHQTAQLLMRYPGGKAVNVAKALCRLGVPCVLTGLVGAEDLEFFARDVAGSRVKMEMLPVAGPTRENITLVDPIARQETHLRDRGFAVSSVERDALARKLADLAAPDCLFVFSGSLPRGIEPTDFSAFLSTCRRKGAGLAVDASGPALSAAVHAGPWLVKPNRHELEELLHQPLTETAMLLAAGRDLARRIDLVLLSCGDEGAYLFTGTRAWHGRCVVPPERVANTVGCGDALLAGFLAGLHKTQSPDAALRIAVAAAAASAMSLTPLFGLEHFEALLPQVMVTQSP